MSCGFAPQGDAAATKVLPVGPTQFNRLQGDLVSRELETSWGVIRGSSYYPRKRHAGFFSQSTTSLIDLANTAVPIQKIIARRAFAEYRSFPGINSWSIFFRQPSTQLFQPLATRYQSPMVVHEIYSSLDLREILPFVDHYFRPSVRVEKRIEILRSRYDLSANSFVAVNIRGTDKQTELPLAPIESYLIAAENALRKSRQAKLLLVTDQTQFVSRFIGEFGERLITIRELPTTTSDEAIHAGLKQHQRQTFGLNFLATILIIASASKVVTHTGNGAFWTTLFRKGCANLVQLRGDEVFGEA